MTAQVRDFATGDVNLVRQIVADTTGLPVVATEAEEPVLLGASILGALAASAFPDMSAAMAAMTRSAATFQPAGGDLKAIHAERFATFEALQSAVRTR